MIRKLAHWLTRRPRFILTIALLLLIPSILGYIGTKVNYDVLSYLPENVSSVAGEKLLEDPFQAAATTMVIVEDMPPAYTDGLLRDIKKIDHVSNAIWVSDLIGIQVPTDLLPGTIRDNFYKDGATMMIVQLDKPLSSEESMEAIVRIRRLMNERCFAAGMTGMVQDIKELVLSELPVYTVIAVILTLIVLLLAFESPVITFLFLACIGLAVAYNMGSNIVLGQISYITQAIAAILQLAVTMDYSIFLYRRYEEEKVKHEDIRDAMTEAMAAAFSALSGSSLTTIAGFLSLCAMQFTLGMDLGIVMAKGIVVGILAVVLILPCFILIFDKYIEKWQHRSLFPDFTNFNRWILKHRRIWILGFVLMLIPSYYSDKHTEIYYRISQSLPEDLPSLVSQRKMEELFDIATEHIVILDGNLDNGTMGELEARLEAVPGIESVISYHKIIGNGIPDFFLPEKIRSIFHKDGMQLVMMTSDFGPATAEVSEQLDEISAIVAEYDPGFYLTGEAAMTEDLRTVFDKDYVVTSWLSIAAIFLIVMFVFRSLTVPLILIIAIEHAIYFNVGICYFQGKSISFIAPVLISAIQLGATVDYAILITSRFQEEIRNGRDRMEAAIIAGKTSAASILTSALVMFAANIGVTLVSRMYIIQEICLLLSRGALVSGFITIFVMPCLLYEFEPVFRRTTLDWDGKKAAAAKAAAGNPDS